MEQLSPLLIGLAALVVVVVLILGGIHVAAALFIVGIAGLSIVRGFGVAYDALAYIPYAIVANYNNAIFPLFLFMGELASVAGITAMLFDGAEAWLGRIRGGLAMAVSTMACALGAVTGSALAACAMMTRAAFPEMVRHKYDPATIAGVIAASAPLAVIIPPSIGLAFYGTLTEESVGKLLIAGVIPGVMGGVIYIGLIFVLATFNPKKWPVANVQFTWGDRRRGVVSMMPILMMMAIVLGGLYAGVFSPSEAGAAGAFVLVGFVVYFRRGEAPRACWDAVWGAVRAIAMLAWILMGALFFSRFMALTGASEQIVIAIAALPIGKYGIFALLVVLFLFLGCFLEPLPMMAITLPVVHPLIKQLGLDPIWFGVVLQVLVGCGMITPPFGFNVFGVKALIGDAAELMAIFKAALPFLIAMLLMILILTIFPQIALFLPEMMA